MEKLKIKPIVKWAGGKRQIKSIIIKEIEKVRNKEGTYFEPFFGGGAIFFDLLPKSAVINDLNSELINVYEIVRDYPEELVEELKTHKSKDSDEYYYDVRKVDRNENFEKVSNIKKAARTIYLNKTCYNGLYRVNKSGQFNTPRGRYVNPSIFDEENIRSMSNYFNNEQIKISKGDYKNVIKNAVERDLIYFDPPYDYEVENNGFTAYTHKGFDRKDLDELKKCCDSLIEKGCDVFVSNNKTTYVESLFKSDNYTIVYRQKTLKANRNINSNGKKRKKVSEVLIYGSKSVSTSK